MVAKNRNLIFQENQKVVCSSHGLGVITGVEERSDSSFYKINFKKEKLSIFVPVNRVKEIGVRKLCSKETATRVFGVLEKPSRIGRGMWSRRAQEYDTKMYSGSLLLTAEIVRDLFSGSKDPNRSYSERVVYESAFNRVEDEISAVLGYSQEESKKKILDALSKSAGSVKAKVFTEATNDFDDEDLDDFDDTESEDSSDEMVA